MANYVNGLYVEEKEGQYGKYLSISITPKGLEELSNLPKSTKGNINLTASRQKNDASKYSVKPYVPKTGTTVPEGNDDDLPF